MIRVSAQCSVYMLISEISIYVDVPNAASGLYATSQTSDKTIVRIKYNDMTSLKVKTMKVCEVLTSDA